MKKSALVLAMMLALSLFTFVGCGNNKATDMNGNGMNTERNGGVVNETEKAVDDMGNAVEDGVDDMGDAVEDMTDMGERSTDRTTEKTTDKTTDKTKNTTKQ